MNNFFFHSTCFVAYLFSAPLLATKEHELWWENNLENEVSLDTFFQWLGDINAPSRVAMRRHVQKMKYSSILDVPSGLCLDYWGLVHEHIPILYQGADITHKLVLLAQAQQVPIIEADIESMPFENNQFDICYARHILEHLENFENALKELIRVAKHEVFVVFFIAPTRSPTTIDLKLINENLLFHNTYNISDLESFILKQPSISQIEWKQLETGEAILQIYLSKKEN